MVEVGWRDDGANLVGLGAIPGMGSWLKNDYRNVSKSSIFCDFYHGFAGVSRQWLRYVCGGLWLVLRLSWGVGVGASGAVGAGLSWDGFVVTVAIKFLWLVLGVANFVAPKFLGKVVSIGNVHGDG
eukprot:CAMPEP_0168279074 /NCGR_PEP_ID=MMETSP0141_2-20121125/20269_1 /TAXON_ID=44445 /ORGANISM="Pseudo-nitzschia australis, Strain 10249 10 AB" /LENGTH=125 /DNA_ID=CAMNT_0008221967 /DNA_START=240 /DNA_END=617 /DNA_ORIENTATION=+